MEASKTLHLHLEGWRKQRRLSQEQVANLLGTHKSTISRWENGERSLDLADLERLASIYGVEPVALLLAPGNLDLARWLGEAKAILEVIPEEAAKAWLATGNFLRIAHDS